MSSTRQTLRLANLEDLATIALHHPVPTQWPPPDTHIDYRGPASSLALESGGALLFEVVSDSGDLPAAGFWWSTLGNVVLGSLTDSPAVQAAISLLVNEFGSPWAGAAAAYPVVFERNEGLTMKWLRTTYRGELGGGVEQFQFHMDLGDPGSDPDLDEAACLALAGVLKGVFETATTPLRGQIAGEVQFAEVGVVQMEATSATSADGSGGNAKQAFATQWAAWPIASAPRGLDAAPALPYETTCAVSLQTDHRGPSGRGRFYLPPFTANQMVTGGVFGGIAQNVANGAATWIDAIHAAQSWRVIVVSPRRLILNEVTSVNVGVVPDSQRRRRRSQSEARKVASITPG